MIGMHLLRALAALAITAMISTACVDFGGDDDDEPPVHIETPAPSPAATVETPSSTPTANPTTSPPQPAVETETPAPSAPGVLTINWIPLRYTGPEEVTFLNDLLDDSEPINEAVIFQLETVLEDQRGWQRAGLDFRRVTEIPDSINDDSVDLYIFVANAGAFPCASAGTEDTVVVGCSVGGEFPNQPPCVLIIPDFERSEITVNHEVGHCLRIMHNPAPGVMSEFINNATDYPTEDEIAVVSELLDPFRDEG